MTRHFQYSKYANSNRDVADRFGGDDALALEEHYTKFGAQEQRGIEPADYLRIEGMVLSDEGDLFIAGWADRRIFPTLSISLDIGFYRYDLGQPDLCWYHRRDVSELLCDFRNPAGFIAVLKIDDLQLHSRVDVIVNGRTAYSEGTVRWRSAGQFLFECLSALAVLADLPVARSMGYAERVHAQVSALWRRYLNEIEYFCAFRTGDTSAVRLSVVIVLYRKADMLIPQLRDFAALLAREDVEVVVVANDLLEPDRTVGRLRALSQLLDMRLSIYLSSGNSGFSAANNFGASVAQGEVLVFMNPDIFLPETNPEGALGFFDSDPGDALVGAMLYYGNGSLMHAGMYAVRETAVDAATQSVEQVLRVEHFGKGLAHAIDDPAEAAAEAMAGVREDVLLASAALWKIRRSVFEEIGGLPTDYVVAYYEDADFCLALREAGHGIRIDDTARFVHMEGVGSAVSPAVRSFMWLNRYLFSRRFVAAGPVVELRDDLTLL